MQDSICKLFPEHFWCIPLMTLPHVRCRNLLLPSPQLLVQSLHLVHRDHVDNSAYPEPTSLESLLIPSPFSCFPPPPLPPTHSSKVQFLFCNEEPMQFLPLLDGGGLVQVLVLVFKHFWLHSPQFPQTVQPPATGQSTSLLHSLNISLRPTQALPPWAAGGWVHERERV